MIKKIVTVLVMILFTGCAQQQSQQPMYYPNPDYNKPYTPATPVTNLTIGKIQRHIYRGMSQYEVISILGSPNLVTGSSDRTEAWIYDKQFTSITKVQGKMIFAGPAGEVSFDSEVTTPNVIQETLSHKTLTLVIDFDVFQRVSRFNYHYSSF